MKQILLLTVSCLVLGCSNNINGGRQFTLDGVWTLRQMDYPIGRIKTFSEDEGTMLCLYDGDSMLYQCALSRTGTGLVIRPLRCIRISLIDKGHGEYVYLEDDDPHPLTFVDDSTITIQRNGILSTCHRDDGIAAQWGAEIREIVAANKSQDSEEMPQGYMLSVRERQQASIIQWLVAAFAVLVAVAVSAFVVGHRRRRQLLLQLQQIQEVKEARPQSVRLAVESVEAAYFASDEYRALQRRIATGEMLKADDWHTIESQIRKVYPGFGSQLRGLYAMSELEYRVCLLIKLRILPSDIAAVMARDASTISTVRSRLYKKVFGRKGGAKEWDEFILSVGA